MPSVTQLTMPVTMIGGMVVGLWFVFQQYTALNVSLADLQKTHNRFEYEVRLQSSNERLRQLEKGKRTEAEQREYERLMKAVIRYEAERDKLL
jgi:hypothetical protein